MTFEQFWTILLKQWKLVLIYFLFVGLGTFIGSKLMTPVYQSSALVQVTIRSSNNQTDYNNLLASSQLVQTEVALATSDPVLHEVASHYPGLSVGQLTGEVSSTPKLNTQLFEIDVVDPSPTRAASLANDIATTLIKQQQQAIQQQNNQPQQQIRQNLELTQQQIDNTTTKISDLQAKGGNQGQLALLQAQLSGLQQHYSQWQTALTQLELTQAQSGNFLHVAQPAQPAISPISPNVLLYTAGGLLAGLLLGIVLAVAYEQLDTRVRTSEVLTRLLEWPVLSTISQVKPEDVINPTSRDASTESYRILRTNIEFSSRDKPLHSLVVTSAVPQDGRSVIAANLAIFMAKAGKNTLLIDADLRHPTQHKLFGLSPDKLGLSNALLAFSTPGILRNPSSHQLFTHASTGQSSGASTATDLPLDPFVHPIGIPNLWVMPSGPLPPNPPELLASKVIQHFLTGIANCEIEVVIFDTPPLLGSSEAGILASKVDGALVVVDITRATKSKLKQMKAVLAQTGVRVLGCVVNKQRQSRSNIVEDQSGEETHGGNEHTLAVPATAMPAASLLKQRNQRG